MLLNLSNHPVSAWGEAQLALAGELYGDIIDMKFPDVPPEADDANILQMATDYAYRIMAMKPDAVHLMGELTFCFCLVNLLMDQGIPCVASTTHREVKIDAMGRKISSFQFVSFRAYSRT